MGKPPTAEPKRLSLAIPTFNMGNYVEGALHSIRHQGLYDHLVEIIVVDDGSTDDSVRRIEQWKRQYDSRHLLRIISLGENLGRFHARKTAAEAATGTHIFFIDSRVQLSDGFGEVLLNLLLTEESIMPGIRIDTEKSVYSLYWQRSHHKLFSRTLESGDHYVTRENYHQHVVGTGAIVCPRDAFLKSCAVFEGQFLISDDTELLYEMTKYTPILRANRIYIHWQPRQSAGPFFWYFLSHRGLTFADYHVLKRWGPFSYLFLFGFLVLIGVLVSLVYAPLLAAAVIGVFLVALTASTAFFSKSATEFFRLAPIHVLSVLAYGLGALVGVPRVLFRRWEHRRTSLASDRRG